MLNQSQSAVSAKLKFLVQSNVFLTLFRISIYPVPKICYTYPTLMKVGTLIPYLKKIEKRYESAFFHRKSANFAISRDTDID